MRVFIANFWHLSHGTADSQGLCCVHAFQRQTVYLPFAERAAGGVQKGQIQKLGLAVKFVLEIDEASSFLGCCLKQGLRRDYLFHRFIVFSEIYENAMSDTKELLKLSNFRVRSLAEHLKGKTKEQ
ncbi:uncharacterized protein FYW23_003409 [Sylvia borin]